jgi:hypothetical protein
MSFEGTWKVTVPTPMGKQDVDLAISESDLVNSGTATASGETVPFIDPMSDGHRITWTQKVTKPLRLTIKFDLTRTGDTLSGTAKAGIFPAANVNGKRVKMEGEQ